MRALQKFFSFGELGQVRAIGFERDAVFVELLFDDASFRFGDGGIMVLIMTFTHF